MACGRGVDEWCARLVQDTGILLLPGAAYDYEPVDGRQHFRIGFGREDMGDVLQRLHEHLTR
jgi:aspartate/methionine/tyrosine aminotransferase